jgi:hypothetical protein
MCTLREDLHTCMISRWIVLRMGNISDKICRENQNTHFMFNTSLFQNWCNLWENVTKYGRARQARDVSIAKAWIAMATDMHTEYVIFIAFLWQQWFHECASMYYVQHNPSIHWCIGPSLHKVKNSIAILIRLLHSQP